MSDKDAFNIVSQWAMDSTKTRESIPPESAEAATPSRGRGSTSEANLSKKRPHPEHQPRQADSTPAAHGSAFRLTSCQQLRGSPSSVSSHTSIDSYFLEENNNDHHSGISPSEANSWTTKGSSSGSTPSLSYSLTTCTSMESPTTQIDQWTRSGWTVARVQYLIESLFAHEYLPCCLLHTDLFMNDFSRGSSQYCSSALVNALLCLATRVVKGLESALQNHDVANDRISLPPGRWSGSQEFFNEAVRIINSSHPKLDSIPDIQALGILSLLPASGGDIGKAQAMAKEFCGAASSYCLRVPLENEKSAQNSRVRAKMYCGAVSLTRWVNCSKTRAMNENNSWYWDSHRMLQLAGALSAAPYAKTLHDDSLVLQLPPSGGTTFLGETFFFQQ